MRFFYKAEAWVPPYQPNRITPLTRRRTTTTKGHWHDPSSNSCTRCRSTTTTLWASSSSKNKQKNEVKGTSVAAATGPPVPLLPLRRIKGSAGSRIRLILGDTGDEWLLVLNEDDGDKEWQTVHMNCVPEDVATQMDNCSNRGRYVTEVDFGPTGAWYIRGKKRDNTGGHSWWGETEAFTDIKTSDQLKVSFGSDSDGRETYALLFGQNECVLSSNLNEDLEERIEHLQSQNKAIKFIRLFADDDYFISDDEGTDWLVGSYLHDELCEDGKVEDIAIAKDGEWVLIRPDRFESTDGMDASLDELLKQFYSRQKKWVKWREKEIQEAVEREKARITKEEAEKNSRARKIEEILESKLLKEVESICELDEHVKKRKCLLQASIKQLPESQHIRFEKIISKRFS